MIKELICIVCPKGCHLKVDTDRDYAVTGNSCPRGAEYGRSELIHPTRVITSTVRCLGGKSLRCPVKTDRPIPKEQIWDVMAALDTVCLTAPVALGQVVLADVCHTGANVVTTKNV